MSGGNHCFHVIKISQVQKSPHLKAWFNGYSYFTRTDHVLIPVVNILFWPSFWFPGGSLSPAQSCSFLSKIFPCYSDIWLFLILPPEKGKHSSDCVQGGSGAMVGSTEKKLTEKVCFGFCHRREPGSRRLSEWTSKSHFPQPRCPPGSIHVSVGVTCVGCDAYASPQRRIVLSASGVN